MSPMIVEHHARRLQELNEETLNRIHEVSRAFKAGFKGQSMEALRELDRRYSQEIVEVREEHDQLRPTPGQIPNPQTLPYTTIRMMLIENLLRELHKSRREILKNILRMECKPKDDLETTLSELNSTINHLKPGTEEYRLRCDEIEVYEDELGLSPTRRCQD